MKEAKAIAGRIVKAVNMHDELVDTIKNYLQSTIGGLDEAKSITKFRELLKQAEQK